MEEYVRQWKLLNAAVIGGYMSEKDYVHRIQKETFFINGFSTVIFEYTF